MFLKGLIFDFDGLVLDTEMPRFQAWVEIYREFGQNLDLFDYAKCIGSSNLHFDPMENLLAISGLRVDTEKVKKQQQTRELELLEKESVLPGVEVLLKEAKGSGLATAIASSSDKPWVISHLKKLNLLHLFDAVLTQNDVKKVKPDPELFISALQALGIKPESAIAFEDSPNGIVAAKKANLFVIGVPNLITSKLDLSGSDFVLQSLQGLTIGRLINIANQKR